jgi:hypothetical protein
MAGQFWSSLGKNVCSKEPSFNYKNNLIKRDGTGLDKFYSISYGMFLHSFLLIPQTCQSVSSLLDP